MALYDVSSINTNVLASVFNKLYSQKFVNTIRKKNGTLYAILGKPETGSTPGLEAFEGLVTSSGNNIEARVMGKLRTTPTVASNSAAIATVTLSYDADVFGAMLWDYTHFADTLPIPTNDLLKIRGNEMKTANYIDDLFQHVVFSLEQTIGNQITAVPTVGEEAEAAAIDETGMTNEFLSVSVKKYAGGQTFSVELLDRSSPAFFDELVRQMEYAYAKATDVAVIAGLVAGGTDGGNRTLDAAGFLDFVSDASVSVYKGTLGTATNILVSPEQWGNIMNLADAGRPIYQNLIGPSNQGGNLSGGAVRGNVLGLNLRVARNLATAAPTGDNSIIIINPDSYTWYESSRFRLQTNVALNGQIEVAYYGYGALATKVAAGAYKWMVA